MTKVFIDGSVGTTGLQIYDRLNKRKDIELLSIEENLRKDVEARKEKINLADIVFLCLPDDAAKESVSLCVNKNTCIIDTSTAHRINPEWNYGFPELGFESCISKSKRIANPGCHATGFISCVYPLVKNGILSKDKLLSCFSLTGYSGGGKKMIAEYEGETKSYEMNSPGIYGIKQNHKHLPEMKKICGLDFEPVFCPIVDDYYKGMASTVPLHRCELNGIASIDELRNVYSEFYKDQPMIKVYSAEETENLGKIYGNAKQGKDSLDIIVSGNDEQITVSALFDNLGKGASGAAIENMNIVLGLPKQTGLNL